MKDQKPEKLRKQILRAIERSGMTGYALAQASTVPEATISRFRRGADISLSTIERLAGPLNLEIRIKERKRTK